MEPPDAREEIEDSLAHIVPHKPFPQYIDDAVFLDVKELLNQHPDKLIRAWSENPRLYTLLRMLGFDDDTPVFSKFDTEQIGDFWLPLGSATLSHLSSSVDISPQAFRRTQLHVLSKSDLMSEEKLLSSVPAHRHIQYGSSHFEELEKIGKGGSAEVTRVRHKLSGKEFACKRILRADVVKAQRAQLVEFEQEVGVLQRISHQHLVSFVASFTDLTSFSLILNPVAKDVLKSMFERQSREEPLAASDISTLRHTFGCLATAIAYLHAERVRHKDIKPGNILLGERGRVYLCDFGISRDWSKSENSTTEGDVLKFTRRYCAPEVFGRDPRNTKSDMWSLGCVFLEILSVIKGYPLEEVNNFLLEHSADASAQGLWCAPDAMNAWLVKIRSEKNDSADDLPLDWITPMIRTEPQDRLSASDIVDMIHRQSSDLPHPSLYLATCCSRSDSIAPIDVVDSPTLHEPVFSGLGINHTFKSPSASTSLDLPHRGSSPSSIDKRSNAPSSRHRVPGDRSVSPRAQNPHRRESADTVPFPMDPIDNGQCESPLVGVPGNKPSRHISSRSNSHRTSSLFTPPPPESEASSSSAPRRSPVPPPASFEVKCACAPRTNEKHIFNASYASTGSESDEDIDSSFVFDSDIPTIDTCTKCEIGENKVQIYETQPQDPSVINPPIPMMWWITRRLVVSYLSGRPEMRRCSSFWLPLADLQFTISGNAVTLHWSDCNQMTERRAVNYGEQYDWLYTPKQPNNEVTLAFNAIEDAHQFVDIARLPYEDGVIVSHGRRIDVTETSEVNIFDIGRKGVRNYRVAALTTVFPTVATSKLFIQWPEVDLDIRIQDSQLNRSATAPDYQMTVEMKNVSTPTYQSDVQGEPAADYDRVARFSRARQLKTNLVVKFPIGMKHSLPTPPPAVVDMLQGLTGWAFRYFAIVTKFKTKNKHFGSKKYGKSDVLLWDKEVDDNALGVKRRGAVVTIRLHEEADFLWMNGYITESTDISYPTGFDATITVSNKARGRLLNVNTMTAIQSESYTNDKEPRHSHTRSTSDAHGDYSELVLTFEDARYRLEFVKLVEEFKTAAAAAVPLARVASSADSVRRINSLASNDIHMTPPMR